MNRLSLKKVFSWLKHNLLEVLFPVGIVFIASFVSYKSFTFDTWLLGWDDLVPELNYQLNIQRSLSAPWQEYQGLGLLGGMGHAADLPRQLILLAISVFTKVSLARYIWTFLMLVLGPLGVFYFFNKKGKSLSLKLAGIAASVFYIFNYSTLQTFFTPFETFVTFYGFFPWLILFAQKYLREGSKSSLVAFAITSVLGSTSFYVQTLFVVYVIFLAVFCLESLFLHKRGLIRSFILGFVTFAVSAYWFLPVGYYALKNSNVPTESHINSIATPETQLMNKARGDFASIATLKGYWFDYYDWNTSGEYTLMYKDYIWYTSQRLVDISLFALFILSLLGAIANLFYKNNDKEFRLSVPTLLFICYFMLAGDNKPFGSLYLYLQNSFPVFAEIFRNSFTKWSIPASFLYALGIGYFISLFSRIFKGKLGVFVSLVLASVVTFISVFTLAPALREGFVSKTMKVDLPESYLNVVDYFNQRPVNGRVASFPLADFWGWKFNEWGYRGSGYLWYGIKQPILDRAFDVWSKNNELAYEDLKYAFDYGSDEDIKNELTKYQIKYILFDKSIYIPGNPNFSNFSQKQYARIESLPGVVKDATFGDLVIFKTDLFNTNNFVSSPLVSYLPTWEFSEIGRPEISETFSGSQGYKEARNCSIDGRGSVTKEVRSHEYVYTALESGVSCDYFYYPGLDYSRAYVLRIKGKNVQGRSLKLYLFNVASGRVDLEELLPTGSFDEYYRIYPTTHEQSGADGFTLNVETRSFGTVSSENSIDTIEFYPVSYTKFEPVELSNSLEIKNVSKYGTWGYKVQKEGSGLMQLGQGFDESWLAFGIDPDSWKMQIYKNQIFSSWSNSWDLPRSPDTVYVFYWPQLLEWGGMILGAVALGWLLKKSKT